MKRVSIKINGLFSFTNGLIFAKIHVSSIYYASSEAKNSNPFFIPFSTAGDMFTKILKANCNG